MRRFLHVYPRVAVAIAIGLGALSLLGWIADISALRSLGTGVPPMQATTALLTLLVGVALAGSLRATFAQRVRRECWICGLAVITIGALTLAEQLTGAPLDVDRVLHDIGASWSPVPPAPQTALAYIALGAALV